jgi:ribonuclease HII
LTRRFLSLVFVVMRRALARLSVIPELVLADGWAIPDVTVPCRGIIGGDGRSLTVACASILAKVHRDRLMTLLDRRYPGYGLARHKGYPTAEHRLALRRLGPAAIHRLTFGPVRRSLVEDEQ